MSEKKTNDIDKTSVNLEKLRCLIKDTVTEARYNEIRFIIESLADRLDYAKFHFREYRDAIDSNSDISQKMNLIFTYDVEGAYKIKIKIKANILACMQSLHVAHDILAHLISYTLDIKFDNPRNISLKNIHQRAKKDQKYLAFNKLLSTLLEDDGFEYLNDNVNHSKHKYNIEPSIHIDLSKEPVVKCKFSAFSFHDADYTEKDVDEFLISEFNREFKLILQIENELISILEGKII